MAFDLLNTLLMKFITIIFLFVLTSQLYAYEPAPKSSQLSAYASEVLISTGAGYLISKHRYEGQQDKELHSQFGSMISLGTTSLAYFMVKDSQFSEKQQINIVRYSGPILSLAVGVLKEIVYDQVNKQRHTADKHDAFATVIGGGMIPLRFQMTF